MHRYISETIDDRDIITMEDDGSDLSNDDIADDPE